MAAAHYFQSKLKLTGSLMMRKIEAAEAAAASRELKPVPYFYRDDDPPDPKAISGGELAPRHGPIWLHSSAGPVLFDSGCDVSIISESACARVLQKVVTELQTPAVVSWGSSTATATKAVSLSLTVAYSIRHAERTCVG